MHVHGRSNSSAASANGFSMVHQAVEVGGVELPVAEGAPVNASSKVAIVMAGLQPPEDVTSLGVEGLVVAVDVTALHLSRSTKDRCNIPIFQKIKLSSCIHGILHFKIFSKVLNLILQRILFQMPFTPNF
jgi:hypothetical protein